ncbi:MAG: TVP38/TMEM64 family protein [Thermomicrobiales bacterium]|nr:TVP38/TMEM64 family protein [Thermomicrobiales bacterium]
MVETLDNEIPPDIKQRARWVAAAPWIVLLALIGVGVIAFQVNDRFHANVVDVWDVLSSGDQEAIRSYLDQFGAWAPVVSVLLMTLQAVFAPIPASVVQLSNGVVFGVIPGAILNVIGQMLGATLAFGIARVFGRSMAERLAGRIDENGVIERWLHDWGAKALLLVRIIPGMPSDFVSYLLGLTRMSFRTFFFVSLLGYIPQSLAYAWLGDAATEYFWWIVAAGFGISGLLGVIIWVIQKLRPSVASTELTAEPQGDSC